MRQYSQSELCRAFPIDLFHDHDVVLENSRVLADIDMSIDTGNAFSRSFECMKALQFKKHLFTAKLSVHDIILTEISCQYYVICSVMNTNSRSVA